MKSCFSCLGNLEVEHYHDPCETIHKEWFQNVLLEQLLQTINVDDLWRCIFWHDGASCHRWLRDPGIEILGLWSGRSPELREVLKEQLGRNLQKQLCDQLTLLIKNGRNLHQRHKDFRSDIHQSKRLTTANMISLNKSHHLANKNHWNLWNAYEYSSEYHKQSNKKT